MTDDDRVRHYVAVTTAGSYRVVLDPASDTSTRTPISEVMYGWECVACFRAEAPHYRARELAQAAADQHADQHADPPTTCDPILEDKHLAVVVQSLAYTVIDLAGQPPARGLGYGWECLLCDRAEAATYTTAHDARLAATNAPDPAISSPSTSCSTSSTSPKPASSASSTTTPERSGRSSSRPTPRSTTSSNGSPATFHRRRTATTATSHRALMPRRPDSSARPVGALAREEG
jgi:GNAT superfamily N-acetyltransferase